MFDKNKFAQIIKKINDTYDNQRDFSKKAEINRTYLSQYMNMKLDSPPKPNILKKLAYSSNGLTTYNELMEICGYTDIPTEVILLQDLFDETKEKYINEIKKISLSPDELEVYYTLEDIFIHKNINSEKFFQEIDSYFNNIDWINEKSKNKIIKKIQLFIEYCNETDKINKQIASLKSNSDETLTNNNYIRQNYYMCPVYGRISAGQPNWAEECIEGRLPIDPVLFNIINPEEHFFLRVNGESMNKVIKNGAYALIHKQDIVDDGEIAVVLVNGYEATLKHFTKKGDIVVLEPDSDVTDDPDIKTQIYDKNTSIKILGKYVGKFEMK